MRRPFLYPATGFLTLLAGVYVFLLFADRPNHFWREAGGARVTLNGNPFPPARVYRHPDGKLLISSNLYRGWYAYLPEGREVVRCKPITYVPFPGYIYAYEWDDGWMPCTTMDAVKFVEPRLVIGQDSIAFDIGDWVRLGVSW